MNNPPPMRDQILSAAEKRVRAVGFNAVSFRDLALDVGVKSSSVHYHFPQKEDLGEHLVQQYTNRFMAKLGEIDVNQEGAPNAIEYYIKLFSDALVVGESVCLCAILGSESNSLPKRVTNAIHGFFQANIDWLTTVQSTVTLTDEMMSPIEIVSALEGAMIVSTSMNSRKAFDEVSQRILDQYLAPQKISPKSKTRKVKDVQEAALKPQLGLFGDVL